MASIKVDWYALIAMVSGLASSIEASNLVVSVTNSLVDGFCNSSNCSLPWIFWAWQVLVAMSTSVVFLPALGPLCSRGETAESLPASNDHLRNPADEMSVNEKKALCRLEVYL